MTELKCKMCGSDLWVEAGAKVASCEFCGSEQTIPAANDAHKIELFNTANAYRLHNRFDKGAKAYEKLIAEYPDEHEARWCYLLCEYGIEYVDDAYTESKVPTCHRTLSTSIFQHPQYKTIMQNASAEEKELYETEAREIDRLQRRILEVSQKEEPYDVFICYKEKGEDKRRTRDSQYASKLYTKLTERGYKVFFARETLKGKVGSEYEPIIYAALQSAKVMLAVGTKYEHMEAPWVRNEWSRFLAFMKQDIGKALVPCIQDMDPYDMPEELQELQAQNMGDMDFLENLSRAIDSKFNRGQSVASQVAATVVTPAQNATEKARLVRRIEMKILEGSYEEANELLTDALEEDFENKKLWELKLKALLKGEKTATPAAKNIFKRLLELCDGDEKQKYAEKYAYLSESKKQGKPVQPTPAPAVLPKTPSTVPAKQAQTNLDFEIKNGVLKKYKGTATNVTIPDGVTSIGDEAFYKCSSLTSITIPNSVTSIGNSVFSGCSSLTSITIPDGVTSIGDDAFYWCSSLMSITLPDSVTGIGNSAFSNCWNLTNITIPDGVTSIGEYAFYNCSSLTNITIPDGVTSISAYAFAGCRRLTSTTIPDSITSIGDYAFNGCDSLTSIEIPDSVASIGLYAFRGCSSLTSIRFKGNSVQWESITKGKDWNPNNSVRIVCLGDEKSKQNFTNPKVVKNTDFEIENSVLTKYLGKEAVVTIPDGVTSIGYNVFGGCSSLTSITIPDSVTSIGKYAFRECSSLTSITIPDSVTSIGDSAFHECSSLTSITIPDGVTSIGFSAFYKCSSLTSITIPDSVTSIDDHAFRGCRSLTSITIPDGVTSIGNYVFGGCSSLTSIMVGANNAKYKSIDGNLYTKDGTKLIQYAIGKTATSFVIPDGVTSIGEWAFSGCSSLASVTIGKRVTIIGDGAFGDCSSLTSITLPDGVTSIGEKAFEFCGSLTSITLPEGVTSIGDWAFGGCSSLTSITIPDSVTSIGALAFMGCNILISIIFKGNSVQWESITKGKNWKSSNSVRIVCLGDEKSKQNFANPKVVKNPDFEIENGVLKKYKGHAAKVVIPDSVKSIGNYAFYKCSSLTSITIPDSVTSIDSSAFHGCSSLTSITIPHSVASIGDFAFWNCHSLTSITIPDSVTSIGKWVFRDCGNLMSVTIPRSVKTMGSSVFFLCSQNLEIRVPREAVKNWDKSWAVRARGIFDRDIKHKHIIYY